jgi:hypothetical protein
VNRGVANRLIQPGIEAVDHIRAERVDRWVVDAEEGDALIDAYGNRHIH